MLTSKKISAVSSLSLLDARDVAVDFIFMLDASHHRHIAEEAKLFCKMNNIVYDRKTVDAAANAYDDLTKKIPPFKNGDDVEKFFKEAFGDPDTGKGIRSDYSLLHEALLQGDRAGIEEARGFIQQSLSIFSDHLGTLHSALKPSRNTALLISLANLKNDADSLRKLLQKNPITQSVAAFRLITQQESDIAQELALKHNEQEHVQVYISAAEALYPTLTYTSPQTDNPLGALGMNINAFIFFTNYYQLNQEAWRHLEAANFPEFEKCRLNAIGYLGEFPRSLDGLWKYVPDSQKATLELIYNYWKERAEKLIEEAKMSFRGGEFPPEAIPDGPSAVEVVIQDLRNKTKEFWTARDFSQAYEGLKLLPLLPRPYVIRDGLVSIPGSDTAFGEVTEALAVLSNAEGKADRIFRQPGSEASSEYRQVTRAVQKLKTTLNKVHGNFTALTDSDDPQMLKGLGGYEAWSLLAEKLASYFIPLPDGVQATFSVEKDESKRRDIRTALLNEVGILPGSLKTQAQLDRENTLENKLTLAALQRAASEAGAKELLIQAELVARAAETQRATEVAAAAAAIKAELARIREQGFTITQHPSGITSYETFQPNTRDASFITASNVFPESNVTGIPLTASSLASSWTERVQGNTEALQMARTHINAITAHLNGRTEFEFDLVTQAEGSSSRGVVENIERYVDITSRSGEVDHDSKKSTSQTLMLHSQMLQDQMKLLEEANDLEKPVLARMMQITVEGFSGMLIHYSEILGSVDLPDREGKFDDFAASKKDTDALLEGLAQLQDALNIISQQRSTKPSVSRP